MGRSRYVEPISRKVEKLKRGQELDARTASLRFANRLMSRMAYTALGVKVDENGKKVKPMTTVQLRSAEIFLRKVLPDLSTVQQVEKDELDDMSRSETLELLGQLVSNNPLLLKNPDIQHAVNQSQTVVDTHDKTVIDILPKDNADDR